MNDMNKDELKEKVVDHASKVFFYCIKRCNNRMDAELLDNKENEEFFLYNLILITSDINKIYEK